MLGPTPLFLHLKQADIFTRIQQKRPSQTHAVTGFRDMYAPNSRNYVSTGLR